MLVTLTFTWDDLKDKDATNFQTLLDSFDLSQYVQEPTHQRGHTLDLIVLTLNMLGFLENATIGEIQYLCYRDECWYLYRSITASFRKYIFFWSCNLICINLHMIKNANFLLMYW